MACLVTSHHVSKVSIKHFVYQICHFLAFWSYSLLEVLTCSELLTSVSSWPLYPGLLQIHAFGKMPEFVLTFKLLFCNMCLIGWQRDDHDGIEESYNQIKIDELLFWCVCA